MHVYTCIVTAKTKYHPFRTNVKLALPLIAGQLGQVFVMLADNIMVGQLGTVALAGISLGIAIFAFVFVIGMGLGFALPPLVAEAYGKRDIKSIKEPLFNSMLINIGYALVVILLFELFAPLMYHLGQEKDIVAVAMPYLRLSIYSMLPFMFFQVLRSLSDGKGSTSIAMKSLLVANMFNILCNYILIFGKLGFPAMGVEGAALSSLLARCVMVLVWFVLIWESKEFMAQFSGWTLKLASTKMSSKIFRLGIATSFQMLFEVSIFSGSTLMMGRIGETALAAHQIALNIVSVSFMFTSGFALAATIRVGQHFGNRDSVGVKEAGVAALSMSALFMLFSAVLLFLLRYFLPSLYINEIEVIQLAASMLLFAAVFQIPDGVQVSAIGALRGVQDVKVPAILTFIAYILIGLPTGYFLAFVLEFSYAGIWLGLLTGLSLSALFNTIRFFRIQRYIFPGI